MRVIQLVSSCCLKVLKTLTLNLYLSLSLLSECLLVNIIVVGHLCIVRGNLRHHIRLLPVQCPSAKSICTMW